ncbi:hypothetical protein SPRG_22098 [Saprolegnia parasitica CBS 223.65]|uniref:Uncharacterized protein n=1 Tax=Saprolegnia parasitica (strain CBS 223.65) TaxID=695850 RepID=A0A067CT91_SAPPC|nr:hypothetical protein SPRG_22098 [Saprolegnia parasitica CBS 223.65]KDO33698.1 hypothetical protein SPRG_22098 [Saprolegnia parasitica CBS 223.65]|eukprot:XP_012195776.1 hypothetical protein SPRG_22098 [Saprolegnia parasitica CBS 223.65]
MATRRDLDEMEADALPSALAAMAECAKYTSGLAAFYEASFDGAKAVHSSQTKEGVASLQEALALVTSNLTNLSSTLTAYMDCQCDELDRVHVKVDVLKLVRCAAYSAIGPTDAWPVPNRDASNIILLASTSGRRCR